MNELAKKKIAEKIKLLTENASEPFKQMSGPMKHISRDGIAFDLVNEFAGIFDELVMLLLKDESWSQKFSEKYVDNHVQSVLANVLQDETIENIGIHLDALESDFNNYQQEHSVLIPVHGIQMTIPTLAIGNVVLKVIDDAEFQKIISRVAAITQSLKNTQEEKQVFLGTEAAMLEQNIKLQICSEYVVVAEPDRARERAEEETSRVIDLLRFSIPALYPESMNVFVGLQGEVIRMSRVVPILSSDNQHFTINSSVVGSFYPFEINQQNIDHMMKIGVFKLSTLLTKKDNALSDFEKTVLRSVHWFASAQTQREPENKFINLITCLESFLTPRDGNPIGTAIAEAVAILLAEGVDNRKRLKKRMLELYRLRNAVSHGGQRAILDSELHLLRTIAGAFAVNMIDNLEKYGSQKDLLDWIESKKLGAD